MENQIKELKEEIGLLNESLGLAIASILGLGFLFRLSKDLYGPIKAAIEEKTAELRDRQEVEQISRGEAKQEISSNIVKKIVKHLREYPGTRKIAETGSFRYRKDSLVKIKSEIDKALQRFPFSPEDRQKIEYQVLRELTHASNPSL